MNNETDETIDEILPRPGFSVEAALKEKSIDVGKAHVGGSRGWNEQRRDSCFKQNWPPPLASILSAVGAESKFSLRRTGHSGRNHGEGYVDSVDRDDFLSPGLFKTAIMGRVGESFRVGGVG